MLVLCELALDILNTLPSSTHCSIDFFYPYFKKYALFLITSIRNQPGLNEQM